MKSEFFLRGLLAASLSLFGSAHAQVYGNGVRENPEPCDDGNRASFYGCSARCTFEQTQRVNQLKMQFAASTACPATAFGSAFASASQSMLQSAIDNSVADGSTSALLYFIGLSDLSGISTPSVRMGQFNAAPESSTPVPTTEPTISTGGVSSTITSLIRRKTHSIR